jgi:hypothetical protein
VTRLALTHACGTVVHLVVPAGAWTTPGGRVLSHCEGCGEWLGSGFVEAAEVQPRRLIEAK